MLKNESLNPMVWLSHKMLHFCIALDVDVISVRKIIRQLCLELGFENSQTLRVLTAVSEIARNIIAHARQGEIMVSEVSVDGKVGVLVIAKDQGPGIVDLELAMRDGYSTSDTLGFGLSGAKRLMDEFSIQSEVGEGTEVRMIKWKRAK